MKHKGSTSQCMGQQCMPDVLCLLDRCQVRHQNIPTLDWRTGRLSRFGVRCCLHRSLDKASRLCSLGIVHSRHPNRMERLPLELLTKVVCQYLDQRDR